MTDTRTTSVPAIKTAKAVAKPAVLITIALSHYCEKARWALDRVSLPYQERAHIPLLHRLFTMSHGGGTVPLLVHNSKRITQSTAILQYADYWGGGGLLYPQNRSSRLAVEAITKRFNTQFGEDTRRWAYSHLLHDRALMRRLWASAAPGYEARLLSLVAPISRRLVRRTYRITPPSAERSLQRIHTIFRDVDERLRDQRCFLIGDQFTAADLTFAALSAPVLFPSECQAVLPALDEIPTVMRQEVLRLRTTAAGQFALRLYKEERRAPATSARPSNPIETKGG